uniref:Metallophosphoesterase domain containing 1 n=1 Tax=Junco hyemalis TaxID=40217 RepID=A0A8C5J442_JUNHY
MAFAQSHIMAARRHQHSRLIIEVDEYSSNPTQAFTFYNINQGRFQPPHVQMQPWFYGWGFNLPRGQALLEKWNLIPDGIDILITHGPPLGFLDWVPKKMQRVGCVELLNTVQRRIQPRLHVFGHIHEGYGVMADGTTTYVNASVCTVNYQPLNPPIVIDLPTPRNT